MKWKEQLLNLTPYQPGKSISEVKKQYGLEHIVKLASNENPFGCSEQVSATLAENISSLAIYPDGYTSVLRSPLAEVLNIKPEQLIFGNGSDEIILMISRALLKPGVNTVMASPTFPQYKHNAIVEGAEVREVPLVNGEHDLDSMLSVTDTNTAVVWLCSPNNPTGTYINEDKMIKFLNSVDSDTLVVLDEAYYEYVVAEDYYNSLELVKQFSNLIVLRTFSKIYGLASLRVGYGISNIEFIKTLEPVREPFNVNTFAQIAAASAVSDQKFVAECKLKNREGLAQFYAFCEKNKLSYYPSQGNFILIDFKTDSNVVFQFMLERGFIVRSGKALGFPTSIRVTVGSQLQNEGAISVMEQFLTEMADLS